MIRLEIICCQSPRNRVVCGPFKTNMLSGSLTRKIIAKPESKYLLPPKRRSYLDPVENFTLGYSLGNQGSSNDQDEPHVGQ